MKAYKCDVCHEFKENAYRYAVHITRIESGYGQSLLPQIDVCPACMLKFGLDTNAAQRMFGKMLISDLKKEETPNETR